MDRRTIKWVRRNGKDSKEMSFLKKVWGEESPTDKKVAPVDPLQDGFSSESDNEATEENSSSWTTHHENAHVILHRELQRRANARGITTAVKENSETESFSETLNDTVADLKSAASSAKSAAVSKAKLCQAWWELEGYHMLAGVAARSAIELEDDLSILEGKVAHLVRPLTTKAIDYVSHTKVYNDVKQKIDAFSKEVVEAKNEMKVEVHDAALNTARKYLGPLLEKVGDLLKASLKDEFMPGIVSRAINKLVDNFLHSLDKTFESELLQGLMMERPDPRLHEDYKCFPLRSTYCGLSVVRAWILYHKLPYDRSIWGSLRDKWWWFLLIVSILPFWGIAQAFWVLFFFFIDKEDEFQLVDFIISFKVATCISLLLGTVLSGGYRFSYCMGYEDIEARWSSPWPDPMANSGHRVFPECLMIGDLDVQFLDSVGDENFDQGDIFGALGYWADCVLFALQIFLVFCACILIPFSVEKGGRLYKKRLTKEQKKKRMEYVQRMQKESEMVSELFQQLDTNKKGVISWSAFIAITEMMHEDFALQNIRVVEREIGVLKGKILGYNVRGRRRRGGLSKKQLLDLEQEAYRSFKVKEEQVVRIIRKLHLVSALGKEIYTKCSHVFHTQASKRKGVTSDAKSVLEAEKEFNAKNRIRKVAKEKNILQRMRSSMHRRHKDPVKIHQSLEEGNSTNVSQEGFSFRRALTAVEEEVKVVVDDVVEEVEEVAEDVELATEGVEMGILKRVESLFVDDDSHSFLKNDEIWHEHDSQYVVEAYHTHHLIKNMKLGVPISKLLFQRVLATFATHAEANKIFTLTSDGLWEVDDFRRFVEILLREAKEEERKRTEAKKRKKMLKKARKKLRKRHFHN
eukprot:g5268.t1